MLKVWVSKYRGYLQAFPLIVARFIVPQKFMEIQALPALDITRTSKQYLHLYGSVVKMREI